MQRDVLIAVGGGLLSAVAAVSFFGGSAISIIFVYFAAVPLLLVGLALGSRPVSIAIAAGICATAVTGGPLHAGIFALVQALPAWIITRLAILQNAMAGNAGSQKLSADDEIKAPQNQGVIAWQSPGLALSAISLCSGIFILVTAFAVGEGGLQERVDVYLGQAFQFMIPSMGDEGKELLVSRLSSFFPGAIGASWILMAIVNGVVAQGILVKAGKSLRPTPAYSAIDIPLWMSWPLVAAAAAALFGNLVGAEELRYAAYNVAMVFAVPYFFLGLAVIHTLARRVTASGMVLAGVYGVILISLWTTVVVVGVGIAEQWVGLRDRQNDDDEEGQSPTE